MGLADDSRVKYAKNVLRSGLENVFDTTSENCHEKLAEIEEAQYPNHLVMTGEGDSTVRHAILEFRKKSLDCISEGFDRLVAAIRELQQDAGEDLAADIAENLTWEAIDETFNWTAGDRSNSIRFEDWQTQAGVDFPVEGVVMDSPECNTPNTLLAYRLNCDFRTQFEHRLNRLRLKGFLTNPTARSRNTLPEGVPQAHLIDGKGSAQKPQEQVAASNLLDFNGNLWVVRFEGGSESHIQDLVGVQYISLILKQKLSEGPDLTPVELFNLRSGRGEGSELENRYEVLSKETIGSIQRGSTGLKPYFKAEPLKGRRFCSTKKSN